MKFYHIEIARQNKIEQFYPRVPQKIMIGEDNITPRICVSSSIEGCLTAVPWSGEKLEQYAFGKLYRVYVFEEKDFISPEILQKKFGVTDAIYTKEYWLLTEQIPKETFLIQIKDIIFDFVDMGYSINFPIVKKVKYNIVNEKDTGNIIDICEYTNYIDKNIIYTILENYFMDEDDAYEDYLDNVVIKNNILQIKQEELFYKKLFLEQLDLELEFEQLKEEFESREKRNASLSVDKKKLVC